MAYLSDLPKETKLVGLVAFLGAVLVFTLGINSDIYLGDEPTHYRIASLIYDTKSRPVYDPNLHASELGYRPCSQELLWHTLLAGLWWVTGGKSPLVAQFYQTLWYGLLVGVTYLLGKSLYTRQVGLYGALLVATMPLVTTHTIMLYIDIPIAAITTLCVLMLARGRFFWAGVFMGLMILTKRNIYFIMPFLLFWLCCTHHNNLLRPYECLKNWRTGLRRLVLFSTPAIAIILPDLYFRYYYLHGVTLVSAKIDRLYRDPVDTVFIHPSSILGHPQTLLTYLGAGLFICLGLYFYRKLYTREDLLLGLATSSYIFLLPPAVILQVFYEEPDPVAAVKHLYSALATCLAVRYLSPIIPMVAILASKGFTSFKTKGWRWALTIACIIQVLVASFYVFQVRKIPPDIKAGYYYVAKNMPPGTCFLYPHGTLLILAPHRLMWDSTNTMPDLAYLFWKANKKEAIDILKRYKIEYLFIEKDKIVDDSTIHNYGGFPRSFVEKIPKLGCFSLEYENSLVEIWKVK